MLQTHARVLRYEAGQAELQCERRVACQGCRLRAQCGVGQLTHAAGTVRLQLPVTQPLKPGQTVRLGLATEPALKQAARFYLIPLLAFLGGAAIGQGIAPGDGVAVLGAFGGAALAFGGLRWLNSRQASATTLQPVILPAESAETEQR